MSNHVSSGNAVLRGVAPEANPIAPNNKPTLSGAVATELRIEKASVSAYFLPPFFEDTISPAFVDLAKPSGQIVETVGINSMDSDSLVATINQEVDTLVATVASGDMVAVEKLSKAGMIGLLLNMDISAFLAKLVTAADETQVDMYNLLKLVATLQSDMSKTLTEHNLKSYQKQLDEIEEATRKQGLLGILKGLIKNILGGIMVALGAVGSIFSAGTSVALCIAGGFLIANGITEMIAGAMVAADPNGAGQSEQVKSMMRNGFVGALTTSDLAAMITNAVVGIAVAALTMGASLWSVVSNMAEKTAMKVAGVVLKCVDSAISIGGQIANVVVQSVSNSSLGASLAQGASMGLLGLISQAITSIDEIKKALIEAFGESGAMIFSSLLALGVSIAGKMAFDGLANGTMTIANLASGAKNAISLVSKIPGMLASSMKAFSQTVKDALTQLINQIVSGFKMLFDIAKAAPEKAKALARTLVEFAKDLQAIANRALALIKDVASDLGAALHATVDFLINKILLPIGQKIASGALAAKDVFSAILQSLGAFFGSAGTLNFSDLLQSVKKLYDFVKSGGVEILGKKIVDGLKNALIRVRASLKDADSLQRTMANVSGVMNISNTIDNLDASISATVSSVLDKNMITAKEVERVVGDALQLLAINIDQQKTTSETVADSISNLLSVLASAIGDNNKKERQIIEQQRVTFAN